MSGRLKIAFTSDMPPASVEVVAPDESSVGRVWVSPGTDKEIDVPSEGSYLRLHLASGQSVTLKDPGNLHRTISPSDLASRLPSAPVDSSPRALKGSRRDVLRRAASPVGLSQTVVLGAVGAEVVRLDGDLDVTLRDDANGVELGELCDEGTAVLFRPGRFMARYILTLQMSSGSVRVRLPGSAREVIVRSDALEDGKRIASVRVRTSSVTADALVSYLLRGDLYSAASMVDWAEKAEDLLEDKMADPFAAAVGAFLLLRTRQVDRLHDWTRNLMESFPGLPDAVLIRAWHLILRRGDENEIRQLFSRALQGKLPVYTEGLRLLSDGVRLLGDESAKAVEMLNGHVNRSLARSPFTTTIEWVDATIRHEWDVDVDFASGR